LGAGKRRDLIIVEDNTTGVSPLGDLDDHCRVVTIVERSASSENRDRSSAVP
jgi:hypothetical protein